MEENLALYLVVKSGEERALRVGDKVDIFWSESSRDVQSCNEKCLNKSSDFFSDI